MHIYPCTIHSIRIRLQHIPLSELCTHVYPSQNVNHPQLIWTKITSSMQETCKQPEMDLHVFY